ncbi:hypothetical protein D3C87_1865270 [compost metagenome]
MRSWLMEAIIILKDWKLSRPEMVCLLVALLLILVVVETLSRTLNYWFADLFLTDTVICLVKVARM